MMKYLKSMLCVLLLVALVPSYAFAANDAVDLGYRVNVTVTDSSGAEKSTFEVGDEIFVKLSLSYTGTGSARLYGLQAQLQYDSYVLKNTSLDMANDVSMQYADGVINYAYLDMSAYGKRDSMMENLGTAVFQARNNGTFSFSVGNMIVTNKDATPRYVEPFEQVEIIVGSGVKDVSKSSLYEDIEAAKAYLNTVVIADNPKNIYSPDYWFSTQSAETLRKLIAEAEAVFNNDDALPSDISDTIEKLSVGFSNFVNSKIVGPKRWSSSDGILPVNVNYTVSASVQGGNGRIADGFAVQTIRATTSATIRVVPDEGYETEYIIINGEKFVGRDIYTIPEVSRDTTVVVTFVKKPIFTDIAHDDWFYFAVRYVSNKGLFNGTSEAQFSPNGKMSRAMLATVLYRMDNEPKVDYSDVFSDVKSGVWYSDAIIWANQSKIVNGMGKGLFAPNDNITREQIAVMLHRYAVSKGLDVKTTSARVDFKDASKISAFAQEAIAWAVAKGIMKGNADLTLNPSGLATRAEVATMLQRFDEME